MKKLLVALGLTVAATVLLVGCKKDKAPETESAASQASAQMNTTSTQEASAADSQDKAAK